MGKTKGTADGSRWSLSVLSDKRMCAAFLIGKETRVARQGAKARQDPKILAWKDFRQDPGALGWRARARIR